MGDSGDSRDEGGVGQFRQRTSDGGLLRAALVHAQASVRRLTRLADDLVDDARIRHGRLTLRLEPCDLATIVAGAVEEQRAAEPDRSILLELPSGVQPAQPIPVLADADRIAQVVTNYLTNALKYSAAERPVTVRLEVVPGARERTHGAHDSDWDYNGDGGGEGDLARVSVHDEGIGVPLAEQPHVWERFHVVEGNTVQSGSGTSLGLGLYICKTIIEEHHGQVGLTSDPSDPSDPSDSSDSSGPSRGSTFWFTLPLALPSLTATSSAMSLGTN
jgi:signal transduction histidine kinase